MDAGEHVELNVSAVEAAADCWASALAAYQAAASPLAVDADAVMLPATDGTVVEEWYEGEMGAAALEVLCGKRRRDEDDRPAAAAATAVAAATGWAAIVRETPAARRDQADRVAFSTTPRRGLVFTRRALRRR